MILSTAISNRATSADGQMLPARQNDEAIFLGVPLSAWFRIGIVTVLFALVFWPNLRRLWDKTNPIDGDANWQHGLFVPLVGLYYLYVNREKLLVSHAQSAWEWKELFANAGLATLFSCIPFLLIKIPPAAVALSTLLPVLFAMGQFSSNELLRRRMGTISALMFVFSGILLFSYGIWPGQNDYFKDLGMVETLFGIVTFLCGWEVMKTAWFPIVFLICALPWPGLFYSMLAGPLQKFAAIVAVRLLNLVGVSSGQFGTKIFIVAKDHSIHTLNVAEACAGLRSLMTFVSIAAAVAFLSFRPLWQKITMVFSAIPIAIFCNTLRVTVQGVFDRYVNGNWSESFAHAFLGLLMMIPAFFLILLVGWVLQNIFIDEVSDKKAFRSNYTAARRVTKQPVAAVQRVAAVPRGREEAGRAPGAAPRPAPPRKAGGAPSVSPAPAKPSAPDARGREGTP